MSPDQPMMQIPRSAVQEAVNFCSAPVVDRLQHWLDFDDWMRENFPTPEDPYPQGMIAWVRATNARQAYLRVRDGGRWKRSLQESTAMSLSDDEVESVEQIAYHPLT